QVLDLVMVDAATLRQTPLLQETSKTWTNLHSDLRFLADGQAFIWASERDGYKHLYLHGIDGTLRHRLTRGDWDVDKLLALDEANGRVFFAANLTDPLQQQVHATSLDGSDAARPPRISNGDGWHEAGFGESASAYVDTWSEPSTPPQVSLRKADGSLIAWIERNALEPGHPYWNYKDAFIEPAFGSLEGEDGQALHYRLYKPAGFDPARRYPVFMTYYGGPGKQYVTRAWGAHFEQYMAQ